MELLAYLTEKGLAESKATQFSSLLKGITSKWASEQGWVNQSISEVGNAIDFEGLASNLRSLAVFDARNTREKGVYSAALYAYLDYLLDTKADFLKLDLDAVLVDPTTSLIDKQKCIETRRGQGAFRQFLCDYWKFCPITGETVSSNLVAVHVRPWRHCLNEERFDENNGLLLSHKLSKAFQLGLFSIGDAGEVWVSPYLQYHELRTTLPSLSDKKVNLSEQTKVYMRFHRAGVFRR